MYMPNGHWSLKLLICVRSNIIPQFKFQFMNTHNTIM